MDFGEALKELKAGFGVSRLEWGDPDYEVWLEMPEGSVYQRFFVSKMPPCDVTSWHPSHEDLLAEDWMGVRPKPVPKLTTRTGFVEPSEYGA